jgi:Condensation domain
MTAAAGQRQKASYLQRMLYVRNAARGGSGMLNVPAIFRMRGALDASALAAAMTDVVARHSALRTAIGLDGGELVQVVRPPSPCEIPVADLAGAGDPEAAIERVIAAETSEDIDISSGRPFTVTLHRAGPDDHLLIIKVDHLVTDAWSNTLIGRDLAACYNRRLGRGPGPPAVTWQFQDFVDWEKQYLCGAVARGHREFWRGELAGLKALTLRPAPGRPPGRSVPGGNVWFTFGRAELARLEDLGARYRASLFVVLLAIFYAVLYEATGRQDIPIGSVFANRARAETHQTVGLFANMVVLRARLPGAPSFADLLGVVRRTVLRAMDHQEFPYPRVFRMAPEGEQPASTVFHMLAVPIGCAPSGAARFHGLEVRPVRITEGPANRFDLELAIFPQADGADGLLRYASDQYDREYVQGLAQAYTSMARRVVSEPSLTLRAA